MATALGGGTWETQNKVGPGIFVNVVSAERATVFMGDRGTVAMPYAGEWGPVGQMVTLDRADFQSDSLRITGYPYIAPELKWLRDIFKNATRVHIYRLGTPPLSSAAAGFASNAFARAKYPGLRGNDLWIQISANADASSLWDVVVWMDESRVFAQTVATIADLADNDYVTWDTTASLAATAGTPLSGGESIAVAASHFQDCLNAFESYDFNVLGCPSMLSDPTANNTLKALFVEYTRRMREEAGIKFQCVLFDYPADYKGVINIYNECIGEDEPDYGAIYWVAGIAAGTSFYASATMKEYTGEHTLQLGHTTTQRKSALLTGRFMLMRSGDKVVVVDDINSHVTFTEKNNEIFQDNQTVRLADQAANDVVVLFKPFIGNVPNDADGRITLHSKMVALFREYERLRAIQLFEEEHVTLAEGVSKRGVVGQALLNAVGTMGQFYLEVVVA